MQPATFDIDDPGYEGLIRAVIDSDRLGFRGVAGLWVAGIDLYPRLTKMRAVGAYLVQFRLIDGRQVPTMLGHPIRWSGRRDHLGRVSLVFECLHKAF